MSDWYHRQYEADAMDRPEPPRYVNLIGPPRRYDVRALIDFLVDPEGRETRYYGC
jgi:hypothetical protein